MASPNLFGSNNAIGTTTYFTPSGTSAVVLVNNAAASNKVFKINQIIAANTTGSNANATVAVYSNGAVAQGSAPSGGTAYPIAGTISVPANSSLVASDRSTQLYLMEGQSITVTSGTGSAIAYVISYEEIYA
jgi:hypothetical protein